MDVKDTEMNRRELNVRNTAYAQKIAAWLSQKDITPNQISVLSVLFAGIGFLFMLLYSFSPSSLLLLLAAFCIQMRLLCNLFDGMVAIEGGKKTPAGELFNDLPDRIADPLLIVGAGFVASSVVGETLGWICAILAVMTAYVRVLGVSMGCPADFRGPMAKQHRMALLTGSLVVMFVLGIFGVRSHFIDPIMDAILIAMLFGLLMTLQDRVAAIFEYKSGEE